MSRQPQPNPNVASNGWDCLMHPSQFIPMLNESSPQNIYDIAHAAPIGCPANGPTSFDMVKLALDAECYRRLKQLVDDTSNSVTHGIYCVEQTKDKKLHVHISIHLSKRLKRNAVQKLLGRFAKNLHAEPIANLWLCWLYKLKGNLEWSSCYNVLLQQFPMSSEDKPQSVSDYINSSFPNWTKNDTDFNTLLQYCKTAIIDEEGIFPFFSCFPVIPVTSPFSRNLGIL